ncbi:hypothetical protein [Pseudonocardia pini]|uniref:hypothetical protein n=1 Tax=Pseudonocardia pini TaxID=2758030 RepID=UPI0015F05CD3|nr:hypothetical protein [Pseudonocardia pini]
MTVTLDTPVTTRPASRRTTALLVAAGVLFVLYPALRPWGDATPAGMAAAFGSPLWLAAHLAAMAGFVLVGFALQRPLWWVGAALVLPYYGAEAFALHALAGRPDLAAAADAIRYGPVAMVTFGAGLLALAVAAVLVAVRQGWRAAPFAAAMVLFLPQFFAGPELRIAHGVLLGIGCLLLLVRR